MIKVNGISYSGNNLVIKNGRVFCDGKDVTPEMKEINITVEGDVEKIQIDACEILNVYGSVGSIKSGSGDIDCVNITGNIKTGSGDIKCNDVGGSIETGSGNINCFNVQGNVKTNSGNIRYKKL